MEISKKIWGGTYWRMMHILTIKSKNNEIMYNILKEYGELLPCKECREHYNKTEIPRIDNYIRWSMEHHNNVNRWLHKKIWKIKMIMPKYIRYANNKYKCMHTFNKFLLFLVLSYNENNTTKHKETIIYFINNLNNFYENKIGEIKITNEEIETEEKFIEWFEKTFNKLNNKNFKLDKIFNLYIRISNVIKL